MKAPPSRPNYPKAPTLNTITSGVRISTHELLGAGRDKHSVHCRETDCNVAPVYFGKNGNLLFLYFDRNYIDRNICHQLKICEFYYYKIYIKNNWKKGYYWKVIIFFKTFFKFQWFHSLTTTSVYYYQWYNSWRTVGPPTFHSSSSTSRTPFLPIPLRLHCLSFRITHSHHSSLPCTSID